jgi:hypothetical protein
MDLPVKNRLRIKRDDCAKNMSRAVDASAPDSAKNCDASLLGCVGLVFSDVCGFGVSKQNGGARMIHTCSGIWKARKPTRPFGQWTFAI